MALETTAINGVAPMAENRAVKDACASLDKIGLDDGDRITVRGRMREMQGRPVIRVDLLKIES